MKELKDIVLKKGDIIEFENDYKFMLDKDNYTKVELECCNREYGDIIKIERPVKYEIIYESSKQILDQKEKEYLETVIRPFKDDVLNIAKVVNLRFSFIQILYKDFEDDSTLNLPYFQGGSMYKGMELNKEYTLDELGLFKE